MSSAELLAPWVDHETRRFAVAWRNRTRRIISPVGVLDHDPLGYRFQYLDSARATVEGFRAFIGFPHLDQVYESTRLWPFFDLRVMDRKRPDFAQYAQWLGLEADASRLDVLSRSGGEQKGDSVYLTESPRITNDGLTTCVLLVRGSSYAVREHNTLHAAESLLPGDRLRIVDDRQNEANPNALLLETQSGAAIGWVPDLLIGWVRTVRAAGGTVSVRQNNGPSAPWHARLLVQISGRLPPGSAAFEGGAWPPFR